MIVKMAMQGILNGNQHSPPQLGEGVLKFVVVGEPKVGKSTFIYEYYKDNEPSDFYSHNGAKVYPCVFAIDDLFGRVAIFEIPDHPDFIPEQRKPYYEDAHIIVLMYAIDDPSSLDMLAEKWLPEIRETIDLEDITAVLVGNKKDLRDDPEVINRLTIEDKKPITYHQGEYFLRSDDIGEFVEISAIDVEQVNETFRLIFNSELYED